VSIEQAVIENLRGMSPEAQRRVLDYAESLRRESSAAKLPLRDLHGLWANLGVSLTDDDIAEARREMWANFPREIEP